MPPKRRRGGDGGGGDGGGSAGDGRRETLRDTLYQAVDASVEAAFGAEQSRVEEECARLLAEAKGAADTLREEASAETGAMRRKLEEDRAALEAEKAAMVRRGDVHVASSRLGSTLDAKAMIPGFQGLLSQMHFLPLLRLGERAHVSEQHHPPQRGRAPLRDVAADPHLSRGRGCTS
jgi:hypothetical protein